MTSEPVLLITGANTGLGLAIVESLCRSSEAYKIILAGRSLEKANAAAQDVREKFPQSASTVKTVQIDIEDDQSIFAAFEHVNKEYGRVDILLNNAGGQFDQQVAGGKMSIREMWNKSWNVNTTGTYVMTHTFVPLLLKSSDPRLIFITSGTSSMEEMAQQVIPVDKSPAKGWPKEGFGLGLPAYRSSKTGMNMMMREWNRLLKEDGVKVWCISPGMLATGLGFGDSDKLKAMGAEDPAVGADRVRNVVEGKRDADVGKVIRRDSTQAW